jgi:P4 family phage/plasmid primase-like protien
MITFINLLESFAYPLLPGYPIQRAVVLVGSGKNGKTTYLKILESFYGEKYVAHLSLQQLSKEAEKQTFSILSLFGKLLNIYDDLPKWPLKDVGYFKQLTGGSSVEGEKKFGGRFSFTNSAKFYFSANEMPDVSEDTEAFFRRFHFIELNKKIENPRDLNEILKEILSEEEKSKILNLLIVIAFGKLKVKNDFTFAKSVEEIAEIYEKHSNTAKLFCEEMLVYDPSAEIEKRELFEKYKEFCGRKGLILVSEKTFWRTLKSIFTQAEERQITKKGITKRYILGIRIENKEEEIRDKSELKPQEIIDSYFSDFLSSQDSQDSQHFLLFKEFEETIIQIKEILKKSCESCEPRESSTPSESSETKEISTSIPTEESIKDKNDNSVGIGVYTKDYIHTLKDDILLWIKDNPQRYDFEIISFFSQHKSLEGKEKKQEIIEKILKELESEGLIIKLPDGRYDVNLSRLSGGDKNVA